MSRPKRGEESCTAKNRARKRCGNAPCPGQKVCTKHGGASPQAQQAAARRIAEEQAREAMEKLGWQPVDDPLSALAELAGEIIAWKDLLRGKVEELQGAFRYETEFNEAIRGEVQLFERALDRAVHVLAVIAKLNIDERLAAITERQARMLEDALFAAFDAAGLGLRDADQKEAVARAFSSKLALVG